MQELNIEEIEMISGAGVSTNIAAGIASAWACTVIGAAAGSMVPGLGTVAGGAVGFAFSIGQAVAWSFATADSGVTASDGTSFKKIIAH